MFIHKYIESLNMNKVLVHSVSKHKAKQTFFSAYRIKYSVSTHRTKQTFSVHQDLVDFLNICKTKQTSSIYTGQSRLSKYTQNPVEFLITHRKMQTFSDHTRGSRLPQYTQSQVRLPQIVLTFTTQQPTDDKGPKRLLQFLHD